MNVRDVVRIDLLGDGRWRPGVLVRIDSGFVRVAYGGTTVPPTAEGFILVPPDSRSGRALALSQDTWFAGANTAFVRSSDLVSTRTLCPAELFFALVQKIQDHDAAAQES
jgi:hypothetical protein